MKTKIVLLLAAALVLIGAGNVCASDRMTRIGGFVGSKPQTETQADIIARQEKRELEEKRFDKEIKTAILQVHRDGLVLKGAIPVWTETPVKWLDVMLVGHPDKDKFADGERVECRAVRDGVYRGSRTLQRWVYSGPVDAPPVMTAPASTAPAQKSEDPKPQPKPAKKKSSSGGIH